MAEKKFFVDWGGSKKEITFDDDISFGRFMEVIHASGDLDKIADGVVDIRPDPFIRELVRTCIISPKSLNNEEEIAKVPMKTMFQIIENIMKEYPLLDILKKIAMAVGMRPQPVPKASRNTK